MRNDYFDDMIKNALKRTADEIKENPYEKNNVMSLIKERESFKMRNKHFPKKPLLLLRQSFAFLPQRLWRQAVKLRAGSAMSP